VTIARVLGGLVRDRPVVGDPPEARGLDSWPDYEHRESECSRSARDQKALLTGLGDLFLEPRRALRKRPRKAQRSFCEGDITFSVLVEPSLDQEQRGDRPRKAKAQRSGKFVRLTGIRSIRRARNVSSYALPLFRRGDGTRRAHLPRYSNRRTVRLPLPAPEPPADRILSVLNLLAWATACEFHPRRGR